MSLHCRHGGSGARILGWWRGGAEGGISLPVCSSSVLGTHPHAFVFPDVHQGESSLGGDPFACSEGHSGARSSSFSRLLQLVICGVEDLWVVEACDRHLAFEPLHQQDSIQDGDECVGSSFSLPGGLDGLLDLKEAYLQVLVHPESHKFLRFVAFGRMYRFRALCFGLSTTPQVFTRVMAPVSSILG